MKLRTRPLLLATVLVAAFEASHAASPAIQTFQVDSVTQGADVVMRAHVSDTDGDLAFASFKVSGPGITGWLLLGDVDVSGTQSPAQFTWSPARAGSFTARIEVNDTTSSVSSDRTFEVFPSTLTIPRQVVTSGVNRMYTHEGEILTPVSLSSPAVTTQNGGNLILWSGGRVILKPGFRAESGAFFWAAVDHDMNGYSDIEELADADGDGMPDAWEVDHGLNMLSNGDAYTDRNNDGVNNLQEYLSSKTGGLSSAIRDGQTWAETSPPVALEGTVHPGGAVTLRWHGATAVAGIAYYRVYRNGNLLATTSSLNYRDYTTAAGLTYSYTVVTVDYTSRASSPSAPLSVVVDDSLEVFTPVH